jgi:hypothetical protein
VLGFSRTTGTCSLASQFRRSSVSTRLGAAIGARLKLLLLALLDLV